MGYRVPFVDLGAQRSAIAEELRGATDAVESRGDWILGQDLTLFEAEFAEYCDSAYGVGVDSGMSALELTLRALGVGEGDEVVTAANTFIATAFAIVHVGATPVLADIDPATYTLDPAAVEAAITERTQALIPVHLYGHPADMDSLNAIARRHGLAVVEDACQAHGARYRGRRVGSLGHAAAFSFYPAKNLGAHGDGGMVITSDPDIRERLRVLRDYGQRAKHDHVEVGYNRRLDTLQAAILRVKLRHLDDWNTARRAAAALYDELLTDAVVTPQTSSEVVPVWHLYAIETKKRDRLAAFLEQNGIATGIHYPRPVHRQTAFKGLGCRAGAFPAAEAAATRLLSLPMYAELSPAAARYVATTIRNFFARPSRDVTRVQDEPRPVTYEDTPRAADGGNV